MKKPLLLISCKLHTVITAVVLQCALFCMSSTQIHAQTWTWARSAGSTGNDQGRSVVSDQYGNIYAAGFFNSPTLTVGTTTLTNSGGNDILLIKYDSTGAVLWTRSAGGSLDEGAIDIDIDGAGNIYIAGSFKSTNLTFGTNTLPVGGGVDMFVAKYDPSGNAIWAKSAGGNLTDEAQQIDVDASGAIYVSGKFGSSSISFGSSSFTCSGTTDGFLAKYDTSGTVIWAKSFSGTGSERGEAVSSDNAGNVFLAGVFSSPTLTIGTTTLTNVVGDDIYLTKLDSAGNFLWAKRIAGPLADSPKSISTDLQGNAYVGGFFNSSSLDFGSVTLNSAGLLELFIAKYDGAGNVLWARNAGSSSTEVLNGMITDPSGNSYITGYFDGSSVTFGSTTLSNSGTSSEIHVVKYDPSGTVLWAKKAGGSAADFGYGICLDPAGSLYITGMYESSNCAFGGSSLPNGGMWDFYIAKMAGVTTGINQPENTGEVDMYPNPAYEMLTLKLSDTYVSAVSIFSMEGKVVYHTEAVKDQLVISIQDLPAGIYSVLIQSQNHRESRKLVVVREE